MFTDILMFPFFMNIASSLCRKTKSEMTATCLQVVMKCNNLFHQDVRWGQRKVRIVCSTALQKVLHAFHLKVEGSSCTLNFTDKLTRRTFEKPAWWSMKVTFVWLAGVPCWIKFLHIVVTGWKMTTAQLVRPLNTSWLCSQICNVWAHFQNKGTKTTNYKW